MYVVRMQTQLLGLVSSTTLQLQSFMQCVNYMHVVVFHNDFCLSKTTGICSDGIQMIMSGFQAFEKLQCLFVLFTTMDDSDK